MKKILTLAIAGSLLTVFLLLRTRTASDLKPYRAEDMVMGTTAHVIIVPGPEMTVLPEKAAKAAFEAMHEVDRLMSSYRADSDVSRLNISDPGTEIAVHPLTFRVLEESLRFHKISGGAFDVTVHPLFALYPYKKGPVQALPSAARISEVLQRVGSDKVRLNKQTKKASFQIKGMSLSLGAIAKGFAVDRAMCALIDCGVRNAMVEAGGELRLMGMTLQTADAKTQVTPFSGPPTRLWRTGIRHPRKDNEFARKLERTDCAVATSGDYAQFFEIKGKRYSHIIDPRTGLPVEGGVVSATIIHPDSCMIADALATTISVLRVEKARELLKQFPATEAILYVLDDDGKVRENPTIIRSSAK